MTIEIGAVLVLAFCFGSAFGRWLEARVVKAQAGQIRALKHNLDISDNRLRQMQNEASCAMEGMRQVNLTISNHASVVMERYADACKRLTPHMARAHDASFEATYSAKVH